MQAYWRTITWPQRLTWWGWTRHVTGQWKWPLLTSREHGTSLSKQCWRQTCQITSLNWAICPVGFKTTTLIQQRPKTKSCLSSSCSTWLTSPIQSKSGSFAGYGVTCSSWSSLSKGILRSSMSSQWVSSMTARRRISRRVRSVSLTLSLSQRTLPWLKCSLICRTLSSKWRPIRPTGPICLTSTKRGSKKETWIIKSWRTTCRSHLSSLL